MVYFSERLHVVRLHAGDLVHAGAIGRVVQVLGLGPICSGRRSGRPGSSNAPNTAASSATSAATSSSSSFSTAAPPTPPSPTPPSAISPIPTNPSSEDFGEASLLGDNGTSNYIRVDWFTPAGLSTWGDGRTVILGTKGYIELRKYVDVGRDKAGDNLISSTDQGEQFINVAGKVGFRFFGEFILDCLNRTEKAMTQAHAFKAAELCLRAQAAARRIA